MKYIGLLLASLVLFAAAARFAPAQVIQNGGGNFQAAIAGNTLSAHNFANQINTAGTLIGAQPACGDLTGAAASCGTNATELSSGTVSVARGGLGASTGAPMWTRYYGTGADGAGPASGAWPANVFLKNLTSWTCTGAITTPANESVIVRSQGTVALNTGCSITTSAVTTTEGNNGGSGGSGGSGAANSVAASPTTGPVQQMSGNTATLSLSNLAQGGGASSSSAGNAGQTPLAGFQAMAFDIGYAFREHGGSPGSAGGSSGGAAGNGGGCIIIVAPTITIASGVTLDASGGNGVAPAANSTGAGGGGGGGCIWFASQTFTDSGAIYKYGGGPGGAITQPAIYATGGGCNTTGCGTGANFTVTALSGGGLSAGSITIANAGSGYQTAPTCTVYAGTSGLTGSPACHFTLSGGTIASVVIDTAGTGGTLTTFTTTFIGGYGGNGFYEQALIQ